MDEYNNPNSQTITDSLNHQLPHLLELNKPRHLKSSPDTDQAAKLIGQTFLNSVLTQLSRHEKIDDLTANDFMTMIKTSTKWVTDWVTTTWNAKLAEEVKLQVT